MLKLKRFSFSFLIFFGFSLQAHAQTFIAELERIDQLRAVYGNQVVSAMTNLPPAQYKIARDQALALADKVKNNAFAREDAKATVCASLAKYGPGCHDSQEAISGVAKPQADNDIEKLLSPSLDEEAPAAAPSDAPAEKPAVQSAEEEVPLSPTTPIVDPMDDLSDDSGHPAADTDRHVSSDSAPSSDPAQAASSQ